MGDFTEVFLGLLDNFRGCLDQVVYNGLDVFREVQEDPKSADVYGVEWTCSDEFDAPADTAISFIKQGAYVAFQDSYPRTGGSIRMEVKTQKENALLMYNTGRRRDRTLLPWRSTRGSRAWSWIRETELSVLTGKWY
nr:uncharacterized protein LOC113822185 [Penaeus vannamei]